MKKVDFYRYGKHKKLNEFEFKDLRITQFLRFGNQCTQKVFYLRVKCDSVIGLLYPEFICVNEFRKQLIKRMYQKSKEIMK
jgi:hypothetical protein